LKGVESKLFVPSLVFQNRFAIVVSFRFCQHARQHVIYLPKVNIIYIFVCYYMPVIILYFNFIFKINKFFISAELIFFSKVNCQDTYSHSHMVAKTEDMEYGAWGKRAVLRIFYFCLLPFVFCLLSFPFLHRPVACRHVS